MFSESSDQEFSQTLQNIIDNLGSVRNSSVADANIISVHTESVNSDLQSEDTTADGSINIQEMQIIECDEIPTHNDSENMTPSSNDVLPTSNIHEMQIIEFDKIPNKNDSENMTPCSNDVLPTSNTNEIRCQDLVLAEKNNPEVGAAAPVNTIRKRSYKGKTVVVDETYINALKEKKKVKNLPKKKLPKEEKLLQILLTSNKPMCLYKFVLLCSHTCIQFLISHLIYQLIHKSLVTWLDIITNDQIYSMQIQHLLKCLQIYLYKIQTKCVQ